MASIIIISQARCLLHSKQTKTNHKQTHTKIVILSIIYLYFCLINVARSKIEKTFRLTHEQTNPMAVVWVKNKFHIRLMHCKKLKSLTWTVEKLSKKIMFFFVFIKETENTYTNRIYDKISISIDFDAVFAQDFCFDFVFVEHLCLNWSNKFLIGYQLYKWQFYSKKKPLEMKTIPKLRPLFLSLLYKLKNIVNLWFLLIL